MAEEGDEYVPVPWVVDSAGQEVAALLPYALESGAASAYHCPLKVAAGARAAELDEVHYASPVEPPTSMRMWYLAHVGLCTPGIGAEIPVMAKFWGVAD